MCEWCALDDLSLFVVCVSQMCVRRGGGILVNLHGNTKLNIGHHGDTSSGC